MFVTTHTVIASTIAIKTGNPFIYIPAAAVNHFIFDLFPHFGFRGIPLGKKVYAYMALGDAIFGIGFFIFFIANFNISPVILLVVDFLAGWPDLVFFFNYLFNNKTFTAFNRFHQRLNQNERPWGFIVDLAVVIICLLLLFS